MLVRTNLASRRPAGAHLAAPAGEQMILCNGFYPRGTEVFGEGEEADHVYQITSGAVRTYKLLLDGRRQINALHLRGEIFGVENGATHRFTAEAVVETELRTARRRSLLDNNGEESLAQQTLLPLSRATFNTPRTTCFFWLARRRWRGWPHFFSRWTSVWLIRVC